jgi:hypothetical protein
MKYLPWIPKSLSDATNEEKIYMAVSMASTPVKNKMKKNVFLFQSILNIGSEIHKAVINNRIRYILTYMSGKKVSSHPMVPTKLLSMSARM